jgi:hypothetical protein
VVNRRELGFKSDYSEVSVFTLNAVTAELLGALW